MDTCDLLNEENHLNIIITAENNRKRHSEQRSTNKSKIFNAQNIGDISMVLSEVADNQKKSVDEINRNDMLKFL
jgi:hypothetical protein